MSEVKSVKLRPFEIGTLASVEAKIEKLLLDAGAVSFVMLLTAFFWLPFV